MRIKHRSTVLALALALVATGGLAVPSPAHAYVPSVLRVGFAPWENLQDIDRTSEEVSDLLSTHLHMRVQPYVASDYAGVIEAMRAHKIDVAFFPPAAYVLAERNADARVLLESMFNGHRYYYSDIITTTNSGIHKLSDLKGKRFAFVDPDSTSGAIYPKVMLLDAGIVPERDFRALEYAGGHDAAVLALLNGKVDACATYANDPQGHESSWSVLLAHNPDELRRIVVLAHSRPIPSDNIAVRGDLDARLADRIRAIFLRLSSTGRGRARIRAIYGVDGFGVPRPGDYAPVREAFQKVGFRLP